MPKCYTCGNDYDKSFMIIKEDKEYIFDSFECAIHALSPPCKHCGCRVIGHGVEKDNSIYCCANCATMAGDDGLKDRA
ncbi:MAG: hypothetical protein QM703_27190 [Gemmatales bacterium]